MGLKSELHLIYCVTRWLLFVCFNAIYTALRNIKWRRDGIYQQHLDPDNYDRSVHVMSILAKHRLDDWISGRESDFVLAHRRFENPEFLLRDDVSLYAVNATHAVFVQCTIAVVQEEFFHPAQFYSAQKVMTLPLKHFHQFAESLQSDRAKIIFLHNQGRCGSTLLTNIFKETGRCVCFNEPHCLNTVCYNIYTKRLWHAENAKRLFRNMIRVLCKPYHGLGDEVLAYVIKPSALSVIGMELSWEAVPGSIHLFMYRDPVAVAVSLRRAGEALNSLKLIYHLPNLPNGVRFLMDLYGQVEIYFWNWTCELHAELELGYRNACFTVYHYLKNLRRGINVHGVRYKHLVKDKEKMTKMIFDVCGMPEELIEKATDALRKDSQKTSIVSQDNLRTMMPNPPKVTPEFLHVARKLSREYGVPGPEEWKDESFHLKNSLVP